MINLNLASDRLRKGLDVSLGVYDLLDSRYETLGGYGIHNTLKMNGREFRLKLVFTF
ncbi:MAG: hypothetical protein PHH59_09645 [Methylovulum sp.]|uniref:hypothetical protein n=1 Tax=Methylovulum sp. TaxID=1916980 RepID=UPI002605D2C7|nr:hypothetical protein [Methylovulum sp.]MDD2724268.1 hypothetical protein [Methylovulum sp.]MDD5122999.1 hypothetical protein [Methylovulum sp.]